MRCVVFTGGEQPDKEKAKPYLQNADIYIAADSGLIAAENFGFVPDLIVGDFDSLVEVDGQSSRLDKYPKSVVRRWKTDKDYSDTELALFAAKEEARARSEYADITLCGGAGGRVDHFIALYTLFSRSFHPRLWLCGEQVIYCLDSKSDSFASVEFAGLNEQDVLSVFSISACQNSCIVSDGLCWKLDAVNWNGGEFSLSNRVSAEYAEKGLSVKITALSGSFLIICPLGVVIK